jgi:hypothetical protein
MGVSVRIPFLPTKGVSRVQLSKKFGYLLTGDMPCTRWERRCVDDEERKVYEQVRLEYPDMIDPEYEVCWDVCLEREPVPEGWKTLEDTSTPLLSALAKKDADHG